jgi:hypothetical protein
MGGKEKYLMVVGICLTLGLAPFLPEPHLWGKLRWLWGGGAGMGAKDYFDLLMHGGPWLVLIGMGAWDLGKYLKKKRER